MDFDDDILSNNEQLALKLSQLPCFNPNKVIDISEIEAGLSQPCFHVKYDNKAYFAKYLSVNSNEPLASQLAAIHGISPKLMYVGQHWLITDFIVGQSLDKSVQTENKKLAITLALLARYHRISHDSVSKQKKSDYQERIVIKAATVAPTKREIGKLTNEAIEKAISPLTLPVLDISITVKQLFQHIELNTYQALMLKELFNLLLQDLYNARQEQPNNKLVLCHGDANFSNVLSTESGKAKSNNKNYKLIDFECACIAPVEFDLAMFMAVNEFDISKAGMINTCYQQALKHLNQRHVQQESLQEKSLVIVDNPVINSNKTDAPIVFLVTRYYRMSLLINGLWYISQYQSNKIAKYQILAAKQFRLLGISHPQANLIADEMR